MNYYMEATAPERRLVMPDQVGADLPGHGCQIGVVGDLVRGPGLAVREELAGDAGHLG